MFISCFGISATSESRHMGSKMLPKLVQILTPTKKQIWGPDFNDFVNRFGVQNGAKMNQDDLPKRSKWAKRATTNNFKKKKLAFTLFWDPRDSQEASQNSSRQPSRTSQQKQKRLIDLLSKNGPQNASKSNPKNIKKLVKQIYPKMIPKMLLVGPRKAPAMA